MTKRYETKVLSASLKADQLGRPYAIPEAITTAVEDGWEYVCNVGFTGMVFRREISEPAEVANICNDQPTSTETTEVTLCRALAASMGYEWHPGIASTTSEKITELAQTIERLGVNQMLQVIRNYSYLRNNCPSAEEGHSAWWVEVSKLSGSDFDREIRRDREVFLADRDREN